MNHNDNNIVIEECSLREAYKASRHILEFEPWYPWEKWEARTTGRQVIALIARIQGDVAGFKVGYYEDDHFYSWVGGVLPAFRQMGVATALAERQEAEVRLAGTSLIRMKTRNRFKAMLCFALGRGFHIERVEQKGEMPEWRIILSKKV